MHTKKPSSKQDVKEDSSKRATPIAVGSLAISLFGLCVSLFSVWHGVATERMLQAGYFDHQLKSVTTPSVGARPQVVLDFKNTGRSRATVQVARASLLVAQNERDALERLLKLEPTKLPTVGEINPDGRLSAPLKLGHDISPDELERLRQGELNVYVVGRLDYTDLFGTRHVRFVCDRFDFDDQSWVGCPSGNETLKQD